MSSIKLVAMLTACAALALSGCGELGLPSIGEGADSDASSAPEVVNGLKTPAAFAMIEDDARRGEAIFAEMLKVIEHPRCMNCHPRGDAPTQGAAFAAHQPPVVRGPDGSGAPAMRCNTCHGDENVTFVGAEGSIPGHALWHLAPQSMGWRGASGAEICAQIKDPSRNGGKDLEALHEHNANDALVGWAWAPGEGRASPPGDQATFGALTLAWAEAGAACPSN
ncbi:MAG: Isoquinoline 1-oxidoreductase subunit [Pseudomonadota bacterium]